MSEQPAAVAREAKKIHQSLKELLKTKEPFDREVEFLRKSLRKNYLSLLLVHPNSNDSKDVENHLWMQTSYAFISSFKQRISALDREIQNHQRQQQDHNNKQSNPHNRVVEHRKLIQRFKQFLADEEKFWTPLVLRLLRLFDLEEARPALTTLGLLSEIDEAVTPTSADPVNAAVTPGVTQGPSGRNHFQFPPEDLSVIDHPATAEEHENQLSTLSKALICLGDIARYREYYNESNGRPRAGHDDAIPARRGRNRRGGGPDHVVARPRNYERAQQIYEQARSLVPNEGNPSHQLAILASYQNDSFISIVHYYRSLCVRQPYDTAAENIGTVLAKALDAWRQKRKKETERNGASDMTPPPRVRIDLFKEKIVVLHALWRIGMEKGVEKMKLIAQKHGETVAADFYSLVSERHLPIDMILNTVVLSQSALWKHRMFRDSPHRKSESSSIPEGAATVIEWAILNHLLDLHLVLLEVGKEELKEPPSTDGDLAQRISAIFRRTLPSLRIASKWLRANSKYLGQDPEFIAIRERQKSKTSTANKIDPKKLSRHSTKSVKFWKAYAAFMLALSEAFPYEKLPPFEVSLEEDIEMKGFLPLRKLVGEERNLEGKKISEGKEKARDQVHPNVEQLMRIKDLLDDAAVLVKMENSPLSLINNHIVFNLDIVEGDLPLTTEISQQIDAEPSGPHQRLSATEDKNLIPLPKFDPDDDDMTDETTRTEDDPVREAFLHLDALDEQDDEVVYMRSPPLSPTRAAPATPAKTLRSPSSLSPRSPILHQPNKVSSLNFPPPPAPQLSSTTTAQDLLNGVMGGFNNSLRALQPTLDSSAAQPKFLFGSELSHRASQSIWSAARDEQPLMYSGNVHNSLISLGNQIPVVNDTNDGVPSHSDGLQSGALGTIPGQIYQTSGLPFSGAPGTQTLDQSLLHQSPWVSYSGQTIDPLSSSYPHLQAQRQHRREYSGNHHPIQPYKDHTSHLQSDPFAFTSPLLQQRSPIQRPAPTTAHLRASSLTYSSLASGSQPLYASISPGDCARQPSMHGSRIPSEQSFLSATPTHMWGHGG